MNHDENYGGYSLLKLNKLALNAHGRDVPLQEVTMAHLRQDFFSICRLMDFVVIKADNSTKILKCRLNFTNLSMNDSLDLFGKCTICGYSGKIEGHNCHEYANDTTGESQDPKVTDYELNPGFVDAVVNDKLE